nr:GDSL-type esterase/lipase family protein [Myxococcota bacterium]
ALEELPPAPSDGLTSEIAIEDASGRALDPLHRALARAARGEAIARLVFYGGSHTASDHYTGPIRRTLQRHFGDAGRGFVIAVPPITSYWQFGARVAEADGWTVITPSSKRMGVEAYGLVGMAFEAREEAWAEVATDGSRASRVEVMYLRQPGGGRLEISVDGVPRTVSTASEGVEAAVDVVAVPDTEHRVELRADRGGAPVRVFGVVLERAGPGVIVDQLAIVGSKARHQLLWQEDVWLALLQTRRPDLLSLSYGNNELGDRHLTREQHEAHFVAMLARLRQHFPEAACLVIGPADRQQRAGARWRSPSELAFFVEMQRRVAAAHGCAFFDVLAWQGGPGAIERWLVADPPLAREDRVHLTEVGYRRLGHALLRAMLAPMASAR